MFQELKEQILDSKRQQEIFMAFARGEEVSLTPARIFQVFYNNHFNTFLTKHPEMGVGTAAIVASLYGAIHVCRKYFQWREAKDQLNVRFLFDSLFSLETNNRHDYNELKGNRKAEFLINLKNNSAPRGCSFDMDGDFLCINGVLPGASNKPEESNRFKHFINRCKKFSIYKAWLGPIWTAFGVYSMAYWWLFMLTTLIFAASGAVTSNLVLFGVPLLFPTIILVCQLGKNVYEYINKDEVADKKQIAKVNKQRESICRKALLVYFLKEYINIKKVNSEAAANDRKEFFDKINTKIKCLYSPGVNPSTAKSEDILKKINEIRNNAAGIKSHLNEKIAGERWWKVLIGAMTGFVAGYCVGVFNQWPILDFLSKVVGVSSVIAPHAIIISFAISIAIGLTYAFLFALNADRQHLKLEKQIADKESAIHNISIQQAIIGGFKNEIFERQNELNKVMARFNSIVENECQKINPYRFKFTANKYLDMETNEFYKKRQEYNMGFMYVKKTLNRIAAFLAGAGTGMFLVRSLFMSGCVIALFCPLSLSVILPVACTMALVWGCVKLAEYHVNSLQDKERQLLDQADIRAQTLAGMSNVFETQLIEMADYTAKIQAMTLEVEKNKQIKESKFSKLISSVQNQLEDVCDSRLCFGSTLTQGFNP